MRFPLPEVVDSGRFSPGNRVMFSAQFLLISPLAFHILEPEFWACHRPPAKL